jgi:hypothetical protein
LPNNKIAKIIANSIGVDPEYSNEINREITVDETRLIL